MRRFSIVLSIALFAPVTVSAQIGTIETVAGGGPDNLPAVEANINDPFIGIAVDNAGNFYIADTRQNRVFKVNTSGLLTVFAGNGSPSFSGDGGPARSASLRDPCGVAVDGNGNLFVSDLSNRRIRRVDVSSGIITTVAGNGAFGFSGDGGPATSASLRSPCGIAVDANGNLFFADHHPFSQRVRRVDASTGIIATVAGNGTSGLGGDGGPATSASLRSPFGLALDAGGNLFIADNGNRRIRRVDASTGIITAVAVGLNDPEDVAVDAQGNLFIADTIFHILRLDASPNMYTRVAGGFGGFGGDGGPATSARMSNPSGVAVDANGNLFIADRGNRRIRRVDTSSSIINTVAGNGTLGFSGDGSPATSASLFSPLGAAVDANGNIFVADFNNQRIRRVDASTGIITTVAGNGTLGFSGDGGPATSASLSRPQGVAVDANGNLSIADSTNQRIRRVDASTGIITTVAGNGFGGFSGDGGLATSATLSNPTGVAVDGNGNIFIADSINGRIRRVDASTGIITTAAGNGAEGFSGDGGPATSASLFRPSGVAVDTAGNLFISDNGNRRIRRVDASTGIITTVAGNGFGGFSGDGGLATSANLAPQSVTVDPQGNLFIADTLNNRIRRVDGATGIITTVAGDGAFGFSGDGGPATDASLAFPVGVAMGAGLFITDSSNHRIRRLLLSLPEQPLPETLQTLMDQLGDLIVENPATPLGDKLEDAQGKLLTALFELTKTPPDNQASAGNIEGAVGDIQAAVEAGLLDSSAGATLMNQGAEIARRLAVAAIDQAAAQGADPLAIDQAQGSVADGDSLRAASAFKDAVNKYKDALAIAEGLVL